MFRYDQQQTSPALSLDDTKRLNPATTWTAADPNSTQLLGLAPALWIVQHDNASGLSDPNQELAAEQAAIWAYTNDFQLNDSNIPDTAVLDRAVQLYNEVPQQDQPSGLAYRQGVAASVTNVTPSAVTVTVELGGPDAAWQYGGRQWVKMYADNRSAIIYMNKRTYVHTDRILGQYLDTKILGGGVGNNTAIVQMPRNSAIIDLDFQWTVNEYPGTVFLPSDPRAAPIVNPQHFSLTYDAPLPLDPSKYPSATSILNNQALSYVAGLGGWAGWVVVIAAILIVPALTSALTSWVKNIFGGGD